MKAGQSTMPPRMVAAEELRIGSVDDSATALTYVSKARVDARGNIYTIHFNEAAIRVHDSAGRPLRTIGREGEGPGEFRQPTALGFVGDTLWVLDSDLYRYSFFDAEGRYLSHRDVRIDLGTSFVNSPPRPIGLLADGTIIGSPPAWSHSVADGTLNQAFVVRRRDDGTWNDTIVRWSIANTSWRIADPKSQSRAQSFREQPFTDTELVEISPSGNEIVHLDRKVPDQPRAQFRLTKLLLNGGSAWTRAFEYQPLPIPGALADSLIASFAKSVSESRGLPSGNPTFARARGLASASLYRPPALPPVSQMIVGHDGSIWLKREITAAAESDWWIVASDGKPYGVVALPSAAYLLTVERDRAWAMVFDELEVPYIVRYEIRS